MTIDYSEKIPNNVELAGDKVLHRALEHWQPGSLGWWREMGPDGSADPPVPPGLSTAWREGEMMIVLPEPSALKAWVPA